MPQYSAKVKIGSNWCHCTTYSQHTFYAIRAIGCMKYEKCSLSKSKSWMELVRATFCPSPFSSFFPRLCSLLFDEMLHIHYMLNGLMCVQIIIPTKDMTSSHYSLNYYSYLISSSIKFGAFHITFLCMGLISPSYI